MAKKEIVLTGDRPTGPLHIGHYVGSLKNRVTLQDQYKQYVMIADMQALTTHLDNPGQVRENVSEVMLDYLAVGIDPEKTTFFIQSLIPQIAELFVIYLDLVTVNRLKRNPTVKNEMQQHGTEQHVTAGFLAYPVHQAADITIVKAHYVPVGADQLPMIEQTNEIVRRFNNLAKKEVLPEVKGIVPSIGGRLSGVDGKAKMSKSLGNAIFLSDDADTVKNKVMQMYTDPDHIRVSDPGKIEGNVVFEYLDAFDPDKVKVTEMKEHYQRGGLGDVVVKKHLIEIMNDFLEPIRKRRQDLAQDRKGVLEIALRGSKEVQRVAAETLEQVKVALYLDY